jgi:hypothetical protein
MNQFKTTLIACFSIYGFIALCFLLFGDHEKISMIGLTGLLLGILYCITGVVCCIPVNGRQVGKAMLLSGGIVLLIGLSVCTINPLNINVH